LGVPEGTRVEIEVSTPSASATPGRRQGGWWRGQVHIAPDFDELPPDIAQALGMDDE
jgi:hypothetical protein